MKKSPLSTEKGVFYQFVGPHPHARSGSRFARPALGLRAPYQFVGRHPLTRRGPTPVARWAQGCPHARYGTRLRSPCARAEGSALVISILVLFVLTALALTLMLVSLTEHEIAVNQRWGEMAFYHAEAGLEYAKNALALHYLESGGFGNVLPPARARTEMDAPPGPGTGRDYQYSLTQDGIALSIGKILVDAQTGKRLQYDFRKPGGSGDLRGGDVNGDGTEDVSGTVTIWVRRPIAGGKDYDGNDRVIVTAEGTAPNYESAATGRNAAVRRLEMSVRVPSGTPSDKYGSPERGDDDVVGAQAVGTARVAGTIAGK